MYTYAQTDIFEYKPDRGTYWVHYEIVLMFSIHRTIIITVNFMNKIAKKNRKLDFFLQRILNDIDLKNIINTTWCVLIYCLFSIIQMFY